MLNLHNILLCMNINFRKWKTNPRIYIVLVILFVFHLYGYEGYKQMAEYFDVPISPWVFPFFFAFPIIMFLLGAVPMLLYSEAPFTDHHAPFIIIRIERQSWIIGQILYIILSSFIYTIVSVIISILSLIPEVSFSTDWGPVLWTLAQNPKVRNDAGVNITVPGIDLLNNMSAIEAMIFAILLYWLVAAFLGITILCFNILFKRGFGVIISAILTCVSVFSSMIGTLRFGSIFLWFSPVSWANLYSLALYKTDTRPPIWYAFTVLIASILIMSVISVIAFCKKDLDFEKGEY